MSSPISIYIGYLEDDETIVKIALGKRLATALLDYLLEIIKEQIPEYAYQFEGVSYAGILSITDLPAQHFPFMYNVLLHACDKIDGLAPYKAELKEKLEADERFEAMQTA